MNESFHKTHLVSKEKMKELLHKSDKPGLIRFLVLYTLLITACIALVYTWDRSWPEIILSHCLFGVVCCGLFACEHETIHNTAFKSMWLNKTVAFLVGAFHLYAPTMFRELHFTHHRHTHEPGLDPEISIGGKVIPSVVSNLPFYLSWVTGLPLLMFKIVMLINGALCMPEFMRKNLHPFVDPKVRFKLALECVIILALHLGFIYLALYIHEGFWALFTAQIIGHCFLAFYTSAEHNGLPHEGNIFEKTRSVKSGKLTKFLMWNMPYHAEHHAYPAVPFHALPQLHNDLKDEIKHKVNSRAGFHLNVLRDVTIGSK